MTRPEMIRADTIDLQDRGAPSAQNHAHPRTTTGADSISSSTATHADSDAAHDVHDTHSAAHPLAHQADTLRSVAAETAEDRRISWSDATLADLNIYGPELAAGLADSLTLSRELGLETVEHTKNSSNMAAHQQQDALAVAQNGGLATEAADEDLDDVDDGLDDDMMDKISSSPSIEDEDIDFDLVYALHTFMATVEGQANATKGDTMVLLDDSNSYWWLVRVVKDSSIGYLPAEHIETPTERLARLNKHRNVDLSATMLGDQAEKTKNPLKSAMRRRKAKTVAFAAPTYVDYSDFDYSTDEEDLEADYFAQQQQAQQQQQQQQQQQEQQEPEEQKDETRAQGKDPQQQQQQQQQRLQDPQQAAIRSVGKDESGELDETAKVEPLKMRTPKENGKTAEVKSNGVSDDANPDDGAGGGAKGLTRTSEEIFVASKSETPGPKKTKDGTVRDSFFKDDTVETKKITLTPNLLRDDGAAPRTSSESKDALKQRPSLDRLDKDINALLAKDENKKKKDRKDKDKKAGGFRSLFSRKDKKRSDNDDDDLSLGGKRSMDIGSESADREALEDADDEPAAAQAQAQEKAPSPTTATAPAPAPAPSPAPGPQRQPSKLQKQQPLARIAEVSPTRKAISSSGGSGGGAAAPKEAGTLRGDSSQASSPRDAAAPGARNDVASRPPMVVKASTRTVLDEFDSDSSDSGAAAAAAAAARAPPEPQRQAPVAAAAAAAARTERLSESPVQVSPAQNSHSNHINHSNPPALMLDTSSQEEEDRSSPISSPSPELVETEDASGTTHRAQDSITTSTTSAATTNTAATWNDASLRAFFDSGSDVRDLLMVVYDKSDVTPVGPDHPVAGSLFKEQNAKLAEITTQLDNMLGDWLARKQRLRGTY